MSDIFISYKREEQPTARKLANALESEGWTVWWDPRLRAGERFNDVIENALKESKCVVVMWSKRSVESQYVKDEATYALERKKLIPIKIEEVGLPFRFEGLHTPSLIGWHGSNDFSEFRRLVEDISTVLGRSTTAAEAQEVARRKSDEADQRRTEQEAQSLWRKYGPVVAAVTVVLIIFSFVFWWPKLREAPVKEAEGQKERMTQESMVKPQPDKHVTIPSQEKVEPNKEIDSGVLVKDLNQKKPLPAPSLINIFWKITVFDEANQPVEGAVVELLREVHNSFSVLASTSTDARGETSTATLDTSGGKFHIKIQKEGYETYSRPLKSSIVRVNLKRQS